MKNSIGISLYLQSGLQKNKEVLEKGIKSNITYVFTSLNIPEKSAVDIKEALIQLIDLCNHHDILLFVDVGPQALNHLGVASYQELSKLGVNAIRLDDGFDYSTIKELSQMMYLVINASTFTQKDYDELKMLDVNFHKIIACHNYYPKQYTGLEEGFVKALNKQYKKWNIKTMMFVGGDERRGPLYEGLPTVENQRNTDFLTNLLLCHYDLHSDVVMLGDIDLTEKHWKEFDYFHNDIIPIRCTLDDIYRNYYDKLFHDRRDSSAYLIRIVESRRQPYSRSGIEENNCVNRVAGTIGISNQTYGSYCGEVEIARTVLPRDSKVNVIGKVEESSLPYLPYVKYGQAFILLQHEEVKEKGNL